MQAVWRFLSDESGTSAIEYAFLASVIGVAAVAAMGTLGNNMPVPFDSANAAMS